MADTLAKPARQFTGGAGERNLDRARCRRRGGHRQEMLEADQAADRPSAC